MRAPLLSQKSFSASWTLKYQMKSPTIGSRNQSPVQAQDRALPPVSLVHLLDLVRDGEHQDDRQQQVDHDTEHAAKAVAVVLLQVLVRAVRPKMPQMPQVTMISRMTRPLL